MQFRVGFFNLFNQAYATTAADGNDINLVLDTTCNVRVDGVPDGTGGSRTTSATRRAGSSSRRRPSPTSERST